MMESIAQAIRPVSGRDARGGQTQNFDVATGAIQLFSGEACSTQESSFSTQMVYAQRNAVGDVVVYFPFDPGIEPGDLVIAVNQLTNETSYLLVEGGAPTVGREVVFSVTCKRIRNPGLVTGTVVTPP